MGNLETNRKYSMEEKIKIIIDSHLRYKLKGGKFYFKNYKNEWIELQDSYRR